MVEPVILRRRIRRTPIPARSWSTWTHGVRSIDLDYVTSRRRDRHGNEYRYNSRVRLERGTTQAVVVFPLVEE